MITFSFVVLLTRKNTHNSRNEKCHDACNICRDQTAELRFQLFNASRLFCSCSHRLACSAYRAPAHVFQIDGSGEAYVGVAQGSPLGLEIDVSTSGGKQYTLEGLKVYNIFFCVPMVFCILSARRLFTRPSPTPSRGEDPRGASGAQLFSWL